MSAFSDPQDVSAGVVLDSHMSIDAAAEYSGYNPQYFRKLIRSGAIEGIKLGQFRLVSIESQDANLKSIRESDDRTCDPRVYYEYVSEQPRNSQHASCTSGFLWILVKGGGPHMGVLPCR